MNREPIKISQEDLVSEGVEGRLREQATVRSTKEHYERAQVIAPQINAVAGWRALLLKSIVYLALFGGIAGAVGTVAGEMAAQRVDRVEEAAVLMADLRRIDQSEAVGRFTPEEAQQSRTRIREIGRANSQFVAADVAANGDAAREALADPVATKEAADRERLETRQANFWIFAIAGCLIAAALGAAHRVIERDVPGAILAAIVAGVLGAAAGAICALLMPAFQSIAPPSEILSGVIIFACFGVLVGFAPGVMARHGRRIIGGMFGGMVGGALGGILFVLVSRAIGGETAARALAFITVGATIGLTLGWLEEAAKQGWLRVASGLIAGKQFILYRNPTFVGSAPMSHIYLFRDSQVGRRHAAIFKTTAGYEIENLPLGGPTLVNGKPVTRVKLKRGDRIDIGRTTLVFDEKDAS